MFFDISNTVNYGESTVIGLRRRRDRSTRGHNVGAVVIGDLRCGGVTLTRAAMFHVKHFWYLGPGSRNQDKLRFCTVGQGRADCAQFAE